MSSNDHATERVALVTGGNKGIGFETVRRLLAEYYVVYLAARDVDRGTTAAKELGARFVQLDSRDDASVTAAVQVVEADHGRLDVLVNNAGITGPLRDAHDYTADDLAEVLMTNVVGYLRVMHAFVPLLEQSTKPSIVNVGSGLGSFGLFHDLDRVEATAGTPLYGASKAAINMMTARFARLLPNIRINVADPGMTATDLSGQRGHSVTDGTDAILDFILSKEPVTGSYRDRNGVLPW